MDQLTWNHLLDGYPRLTDEGNYPLPAYSEFMPPPQLGQSPYGTLDRLMIESEGHFTWPVSEIEQEYELRPGLEHIAQHVIQHLIRLGEGEHVHPIVGHQHLNLKDNPYWPPELASAGLLPHERFVILLPLALSRTQDDMGRVRWTLFGGSEQGPERAFWKGFYTSPDQEWPIDDSHAFIRRLLQEAYGEGATNADGLQQVGFRVLPTSQLPAETLPAWTKPFLVDDGASFENVRYLLTFRPFSQLPGTVRQRYLAGQLNLLPCPHSLVFWGMPTYQQLQKELPLAMQIPLLRLFERRNSYDGLRVPQSGWLHEPHPDVDPTTIHHELIRDTHVRSSRWSRVHRYEDDLALNPRVDKVTRVLFSTSLDVMGLYDKPMARNCQLWTRNFHLLLDGPKANPKQLREAEAALIGGGLFGYRFVFPAMHVGSYEIYWQRPVVAFSKTDGKIEVLRDAPTGYLTAYRSDAIDLDHPVEIWPRLLRRDVYLSALHDFESAHDHYRHQTALNILSLLDSKALLRRSLRPSLARHLLRVAKHETFEDWLNTLHARTSASDKALWMQAELKKLLDSTAPELSTAITYPVTATRTFEEAWWNDIALLSHGQYSNKDNADVVTDHKTKAKLSHHERDLDALGDYLIARYRQVIAEAGMEGQAVCGDLPFKWQTDFDFSAYGGWQSNQADELYERDILVVIPGKNRQEAVVMGDHYDTAYMEDLFEPSRGGSGVRVAAAGADDNHSATATLLQAASIFLKLAKEGRLERDVWLLHLTGEEFPADCLGARHFSQKLVEGNLRLRLNGNSVTPDETWLDLSSTRVVGLLVMDMIGHNRDDAQDIFQISPGKSAESLRLAEQAHLANLLWNSQAQAWNKQGDRHGTGCGKRSVDGKTIPAIAQHPLLHGEVRTADDPQSSLYNTDGQIFSDVGVPVILFMENYDINREGYHDMHDTLENIDLDYGSAVAAIAIETIARLASMPGIHDV